MKFTFNDKEYYIDGYLATQLNSIAYNLPKDWDIIILITGDRSVRVGKSVLAMTICAYLSYVMGRIKGKAETTFDINDIYFDNQVMMSEAQKKPKYSINLYDEGRISLAASKAMKQFQLDLIDFFTECGQLNQIFVVVAPDFFELKEYIAVGRSEVLINVYRKGAQVELDLFNTGEKVPIVRFDRGFFEFFSRKAKQKLFDLAKSTRRKNYGLVKANFIGKFANQYPVDEETYRKKKLESLQKFDKRHKEAKEASDNKFRNQYIYSLHQEGLIAREISKELENRFKISLERSMIDKIIHKMKGRDVNLLENGAFEGNRGGSFIKLTEKSGKSVLVG